MTNSYIPLYRKYRPQRFKDLVGQEALVRTLTNAIELNKVAHAYLLTGPRGTGKTSTARIFAKSLNCVNGPTLEPCGICPSCVDITAGCSIDVIEIDAASNRKVEDARNLLEKVQFVPVAGKYKIYIIDEVHMLTTEAFNTLLKTLEEPPKNLVFILATTESHKVLSTIISRCQRFDFRRIKQDLIVKRLREIIKLENINITDQALSIIARKSSGGMRDALSFLDQVSVIASIQDEVNEKDILMILGSLPEDTLYELTETIAEKNAGNLVKILDAIIQSGSEPVQTLRELINYFRNLMIAQTTDKIEEIKHLIDCSEQFYSRIKEQSVKFEAIEIAQIIEKLADFEKTLRTSTQQHLWLEVGLISVCHRHDIQIIKDLEIRISKLEEVLSNGNIPPPISLPKKSSEISIPRPLILKEESPVFSPVSVLPVIDTQPKGQLPEKDNIQEENSHNEYPISADISETPKAYDGNINQSWKLLLENIESLPSRMFFSGLAKPVEINSSKIVITFVGEAFTKQNNTKLAALEKAAQKLFGAVPKIVIRTPMPDDPGITEQPKPADIPKKPPTDERPPVNPEKKPEISETKEISEQISHEFDEPLKPNISKVAVAEEPAVPFDEEVIDQLETLDNKTIPVYLPEQAKLVLELFNGKVID